MKMYRAGVEPAEDNRWLSPDSVAGPQAKSGRGITSLSTGSQPSVSMASASVASIKHRLRTSERTSVSVLNMSKLCSYCLSLTILAKLFM